MLIFETDADDTNVGKMGCRWDEDAALMFVRRAIEKAYRALDERNIRPGAAGPDETEIQKALNEWSVIALRLFEKYAPRTFYAAQCELVSNVVIELLQEVMRNTTIHLKSGTSFSPAELEEMRLFKEVRKNLSQFFKTRRHEIVGVSRGREAGKKDAKPRERRTVSVSENRKKILAAMREVGRETLSRKNVAVKLSITEKTLRSWMKAIGEGWEDLTAEALTPEVLK